MLPSPAIPIHQETTAFRTAPSERQLVFVDFQDDEFPSSEQITEQPVASTDDSAIVPEAEEEDEDASSDDEDEHLPSGSSIYDKTVLFVVFLMAILGICYYVNALMEMGKGILADAVSRSRSLRRPASISLTWVTHCSQGFESIDRRRLLCRSQL